MTLEKKVKNYLSNITPLKLRSDSFTYLIYYRYLKKISSLFFKSLNYTSRPMDGFWVSEMNGSGDERELFEKLI